MRLHCVGAAHAASLWQLQRMTSHHVIVTLTCLLAITGLIRACWHCLSVSGPECRHISVLEDRRGQVPLCITHTCLSFDWLRAFYSLLQLQTTSSS